MPGPGPPHSTPGEAIYRGTDMSISPLGASRRPQWNPSIQRQASGGPSVSFWAGGPFTYYRCDRPRLQRKVQVGRRHTFIPLSCALRLFTVVLFYPLHFKFLSSVYCPLIDNIHSRARLVHFCCLRFHHDDDYDDNCSPAARHSHSRSRVCVCFSVPGFLDRRNIFFSHPSEIIQNIGLSAVLVSADLILSRCVSVCLRQAPLIPPSHSTAQHSSAPNVDRLPPALPFSTLHSLSFLPTTDVRSNFFSLSLFCRSSFPANLEIASESWFILICI